MKILIVLICAAVALVIALFIIRLVATVIKIVVGLVVFILLMLLANQYLLPALHVKPYYLPRTQTVIREYSNKSLNDLKKEIPKEIKKLAK
jgi:hypothetical protein